VQGVILPKQCIRKMRFGEMRELSWNGPVHDGIWLPIGLDGKAGDVANVEASGNGNYNGEQERRFVLDDGKGVIDSQIDDRQESVTMVTLDYISGWPMGQICDQSART
jgi:hypothetical protein